MQRCLFRIFTKSILFIGLFFLPSSVCAATYYVDATNGNDTNNGTSEGSAWKTLSKVNAVMDSATIVAGDSILFKRGETFTGLLDIDVTGTTGNILTFGAYGSGDKPVIDADGQANGIDIRNNFSYIAIENIKVTNPITRGIFLFNSASNLTFTNVDIESTATGIDFNTGTFSSITISGLTTSSITASAINAPSGISNLTITDSALNSGTNGIVLGNSSTSVSDIIISNVTANNHSQYGMSIRKATNVSVIDSTASSNTLSGIYVWGGSSNVTIQGATANSNTQRGINIADTSESNISDSITSNNVMSGMELNSSATGIDISNLTSTSNGNAGILVSGGSNHTVTTSTLRENTGNGIEVGGAASNITISATTASENKNDGFNVRSTSSNIVFDACQANDNGVDGSDADGDGFSYHDSSTGTIKNSTAHNNKKSAIAHVSGAQVSMYNNVFSHDTNGTIALVHLSGSGTYTLYNNTIYSAAQTGTGVNVLNTVTVTIKNNIINGFSVGIAASSTATLSNNYNIVFGASTANWGSNVTQGSHEKSSNPLFFNEDADDLSLSCSSPAIDAGEDVDITTDIRGSLRYDYPYTANTGGGTISYYDIGAHEYTSSLTCVASSEENKKDPLLQLPIDLLWDTKEERDVAIIAHKPFRLNIKIPDVDRVQVVTVKVNGKIHQLKNISNNSPYYALQVPSLPIGRHTYVVSADYGSFVLRSRGTFIAKMSTIVEQSDLIVAVNALFRSVYSRDPNLSEWTYWVERISNKEKTTFPSIFGAMQWQMMYGS